MAHLKRLFNAADLQNNRLTELSHSEGDDGEGDSAKMSNLRYWLFPHICGQDNLSRNYKSALPVLETHRGPPEPDQTPCLLFKSQ